MRVIIIGNSATAVGAIETMRQYDQSVEIMVFSQEPHGIYSRPLLDHYLGGHVDDSRVLYRGSDFYCKHNVAAMLSQKVVAIDKKAHTIETEAGETFEYDKLMISTGGTPIVPPVPGIDTEGVFTFTTLDDVQAILDYVQSGRVQRAIVVGGGMIGIKATDALLNRGVKVTMVELAPRILGAALDETGSNMMTNLLEQAEVDVLTGNTVTEILSEDGHMVGVNMKEGDPVDAQLLIFGIGVRPNAILAQEAGLEVNRGVVVDLHMLTSDPDIYAAGDVAEAYDLVVDMNRTVAIWPNAYRQGAIAGSHIVGVDRVDQGGVAMNAVEVCGVTGMSIGNGNVEGDEYQVLTQIDRAAPTYRRLVVKDNVLVGAILIGDINRAGIYTGLIRNKMDVSDCYKQLMSNHFGLLSLPDEYRKHVVTGEGIEV